MPPPPPKWDYQKGGNKENQLHNPCYLWNSPKEDEIQVTTRPCHLGGPVVAIVPTEPPSQSPPKRGKQFNRLQNPCHLGFPRQGGIIAAAIPSKRTGQPAAFFLLFAVGCVHLFSDGGHMHFLLCGWRKKLKIPCTLFVLKVARRFVFCERGYMKKKVKCVLFFTVHHVPTALLIAFSYRCSPGPNPLHHCPPPKPSFPYRNVARKDLWRRRRPNVLLLDLVEGEKMVFTSCVYPRITYFFFRRIQ